MAVEAKCWTCARGYARPDPDGCEYIRSGGLIKPDGAEISIKTSNHKRNDTASSKAREWKETCWMITSCPQYERSNRQVVELPKEKEGEKDTVKPASSKQTILRKCEWCGAPIPPKRRPSAKTCSKTCAKQRVSAIKKSDHPERTCVVCRTVFTPKFPKQVCCTTECTEINKRNKSIIWNKQQRTTRKSPVLRGQNEAIEGSRDRLEESGRGTQEALCPSTL